jgi:uncharacterized protein (DUF433 family)
MSKVVSQNPDILGGEPVFVGTRVPVKSLFDHLEAGDSIEEFLEGFPSVKREQVIALLEEAREHALAASWMRLLLDENLDWRLGRDLPGHQTESVSSLGWTGIQNGELLAKATEAGFDALVTMDPPSLGFGVAGQQHGAPAEHRQIRNRRRCSTSALESIGWYSSVDAGVARFAPAGQSRNGDIHSNLVNSEARGIIATMPRTPLKTLDVVALLVDKPEEQLVTGQVGTVVELLAPDVYVVEFLDSKGGTIAVTELNRSELLLLQDEPVLATWLTRPRTCPRTRNSLEAIS